MKKIVVVFPGQGSQYPNMGKDFYNEFQDFYDIANEILNFDIKKLIFEGNEEELRKTVYTQTSVFLTSVVCFQAFRRIFDKEINFVAGHSLGEYTALYSADVFSFRDGLNLVKKRAEFMEEVGKRYPGGMLAILGLEIEKIKEICNICDLEIANYNCPGQIVVSGLVENIQNAKKMVEENRAKAIILKVSGAFHSKLMSEAKEQLKNEIEKINFEDPKIPIVTNIDAKITSTGKELKEKLIKQISSPVLWENSIMTLLNSNVSTFIEVGPGRVLSRLIHRILQGSLDKNLKIYNIENIETLEKTVKQLQ